MGKFAERVERIHDHMVAVIDFAITLDKKKGIPLPDFIRMIETFADELERAQLDMPLRCEEARAVHGGPEFSKAFGIQGQTRFDYNGAAFTFREICVSGTDNGLERPEPTQEKG
jgi:hypothetical protein